MTDVEIQLDSRGAADAEIARYRISSGERLIVGRSVHGETEIVDVPASGEGPSYRVDRGYGDPAVLEGFLGDYLAQAIRLDCCPMGSEALQLIADETELSSVEHLGRLL
jgi:hypothetical protein